MLRSQLEKLSKEKKGNSSAKNTRVKYVAGERIEAQNKKGQWQVAIIKNKCFDGTYDVEFENGATESGKTGLSLRKQKYEDVQNKKEKLREWLTRATLPREKRPQ
jgi:hypothetical protein